MDDKILVNLDDFYFLYPPLVKRRWKRVGSSEIKVTGRAQNGANLADLRRVCGKVGPISFQSDLGETEVVVKNQRFRGLNYWILLLEYTPLDLMRKDAQTGNTEDIGRSMYRLRFSIRFISGATRSQIDSKTFGVRDFAIHVKVDQEMTCRLVFEDYATQYREGIDVSVGDKVEVNLGYEGMLPLIYSGSVTGLEETWSTTLDFTVASVSPDLPHQAQRYTYFLTPENIIKILTQKDASGIVEQVSAPGLPHLRPADRIGITHPYRKSRPSFPMVNEVVHDFALPTGFQTVIIIK